jgi:hypothetical protein
VAAAAESLLVTAAPIAQADVEVRVRVVLTVTVN